MFSSSYAKHGMHTEFLQRRIMTKIVQEFKIHYYSQLFLCSLMNIFFDVVKESKRKKIERIKQRGTHGVPIIAMFQGQILQKILPLLYLRWGWGLINLSELKNILNLKKQQKYETCYVDMQLYSQMDTNIRIRFIINIQSRRRIRL